MNKIIAIGCPVEDREWIIKKYLDGIENLMVPEGYEKQYVFVMGNKAGDKTAHHVIDWMKDKPGAISVIKRRDDYEHGQIDRKSRYDYDYLARARNTLLALAFDGLEADYLLSIDSDIIMEPEGLVRMLETDEDVVAAPVRNSENPNVMNFMSWDDQDQRYTRTGLDIEDVPFMVDLTGACCLISANVHEEGVRYWADPTLGGEDVGFAQGCHENQMDQCVDPNIFTIHFMDRNTPDHGLVCKHMETMEESPSREPEDTVVEWVKAGVDMDQQLIIEGEVVDAETSAGTSATV